MPKTLAATPGFFDFDWAAVQDLAGNEDFMRWYNEELARSESHPDGPSGGDARFVVHQASSAGPASSNRYCAPPYETFRPLSKLSDGSDDAADDDAVDVFCPLIQFFAPNSTDLHDIALMNAHSSDSVSDANDSTDTEDDADYVEPEDIHRHYWRAGDIHYSYVRSPCSTLPILTTASFSFSFGNRRFLMTAEQMLEHFGGVKYSLWHYWRGKKAGRVPYARIIAYLRRHGHSGLLRDALAPAAAVAAATSLRGSEE